MQRVSTNFIVVLAFLGGGSLLKVLLPQAASTAPASGTDLGSLIPYRIGAYAGSDSRDTAATARAHDWSLKQFVLRDYVEPGGGKIEVFAAAGGLIDSVNCYRINGWIKIFERKSAVGSAPALPVRETVILSPPDEAEETDFCLSYWRDGRGAREVASAQWLRLQLATIFREEERGMSVRLCASSQGNNPDSEPAFARLKLFAQLLDPYVQNALLSLSGM